MPPDGEEVKIKRYVVYELKVRQDTRNAMDPQPATIERRYTDFRDMYQSLKRDHPQEMSNIDFPNKVEILLHLLHKKICTRKYTSFKVKWNVSDTCGIFYTLFY